MENTPTGCADDLAIILGIFKHDPTLRSVNVFFQRLDFCPKQYLFFLPAKASPSSGPLV
jgi:hypothetical protein